VAEAAVLFDLDGLLANTEPLHCQAYQEMFRGLGIDLGEEEYGDHWIRAGLGVQEWVSRQRLNHNPLEMRRRKAEIYHRMLATSLHPMPGAKDLLEALHGRRKIAVASSGFQSDVEAVLSGLGFRHYFNVVATAANVARIKPHPDIFLHAASELGVPPAACVVLEDAEKGVLAARSAGMAVIAIPTPETRNNDFSSATLIASSLQDITIELLDSLVN